MAGFTRPELESFRNASVPDLISDDVRLLFVGINPGLWTAATQTHFCHPTNRFYPALRRAGLIDWDLDATTGITSSQRDDLLNRGLGITNLVSRATVRASEVTSSELRDGGQRLGKVVAQLRPVVLAVAGVTAYRTAFSDPKAKLGLQDEMFDSTKVWAVPNPSGLNAHETVDSLADWYLKVARNAGLT